MGSPKIQKFEYLEIDFYEEKKILTSTTDDTFEKLSFVAEVTFKH